MDICHSAKAIDLAEAFVEAAGIDELETSAYAILTNPTPNTLTYKIAFKFDESVSAFNASLCRVVVVSTDTRAVQLSGTGPGLQKAVGGHLYSYGILVMAY